MSMPEDDPDVGYRDEWGFVGPAPTIDGQRMSPEEGFFSGPEAFESASTRGL
jgi:hypothetical protein